jgi:hypothetical protein
MTLTFFNNACDGGFGPHPKNGHLLGMVTKITIFYPFLPSAFAR